MGRKTRQDKMDEAGDAATVVAEHEAEADADRVELPGQRGRKQSDCWPDLSDDPDLRVAELCRRVALVELDYGPARTRPVPSEAELHAAATDAGLTKHELALALARARDRAADCLLAAGIDDLDAAAAAAAEHARKAEAERDAAIAEAVAQARAAHDDALRAAAAAQHARDARQRLLDHPPALIARNRPELLARITVTEQTEASLRIEIERLLEDIRERRAAQEALDAEADRFADAPDTDAAASAARQKAAEGLRRLRQRNERLAAAQLEHQRCVDRCETLRHARQACDDACTNPDAAADCWVFEEE